MHLALRNLALPSRLAFGLSLAVSAAVVLLSRSMVQQRARLRFDSALSTAQLQIQERLRLYEDLQRATRGFIQGAGQLDREKLHAFLAPQDLPHRFPGLMGLVYGRAVPEGGAEALIESLRREHKRLDLQIRPGLGFDGDTILSYAEPETPNRGGFGFNSASSPVQGESLRAARDTGRLQSTPPLTLAQAPQGGPGVVLRLAAYDLPEVPATIEARRAHYIGCINASFLVHQLVEEARAGLEGSAIHLQVAAHDGRPLLPTSTPVPGFTQRILGGALTGARILDLGDSAWQIHATAEAHFLPLQEGLLPWLLGLLSLQTGWILSHAFRKLRQAREAAQEDAVQARSELLVSASRLQAITRVMPDAMLVLDEEGTYLEILSRDPGILAAPQENLLRKRVTDILPSALASRALEAIHVALDQDRIFDMDYELVTLSGPRHFEARIAPMGHPFEGRRCVLWVARDSTERHRERQALFASQKMESLGLMAGGIAHDFNNLLSAVLGYLTLARMDVEEGRPSEFSFERAEASIRRAADLARSLLTYSGRGRPAVETLQINHLVEDMADLLAVSRSKKIVLKQRLADDLPPCLGDPVQLQQVVMNLVVNAGEAMGDRPGTVRLSTCLRLVDAETCSTLLRDQNLMPGDYLSLTVEDDGLGMTPEVLARIFDPFFTTKATGHGLGLSAIRGILKAHRGGILVQSTPNVGTRFEVLLPAVAREADASQSETEAASTDRPLEGLVLLAEDEPGIRESTARLLEHLGMQVLEAPDGQTAWTLFEANRARLAAVMLDHDMPGWNGLEVAEAIREQDPRLPILLCSAYPPQEADALPGSAFLQKPYTYAQAARALRKLLRNGGSGHPAAM